MKPPMSEEIHPNNNIKRIIFKPLIFEKKKNKKQKINIQIINRELQNILLNLYLNIFFDIFKNSKMDITPKIINEYIKMKSKFNIKITNVSNTTDV